MVRFFKPDVEAGVPQGLILRLLLFLICINNVYDDSALNNKLFADDISLFSIVKIIDNSGIILNNNFRIISE